jgi:hypothetical protein
MIRNSFEKGPEGWCSYDYHASMVGGGTNIFVLTTWVRSGGVGDAGYIWADQNRWSADTPEKPLSILPFLFYRSWIGADPIDLRGAEMSVYLRGENLVLDGARCLFWVHGGATRWHLASRPLAITEGRWPAEPIRLQLDVDESRWHRSWAGAPERAAGVDELLANAESYGFSFVDFTAEVTGRFCMSEFSITPR